MTLNPFTEAVAARLEARLPADVLAPADPRYLEEPRGRIRANATTIARPRRTEEVAEIVRFCADAHVGIVPYGGGTGLVLGQVLPGDGPAPLILSLERMNAVRGLWAEENVLIAEAGVILADVQAAATAVDRLFPLALASQGSARIGGNLATNAGGVNVLRYGNARDLCLGVEAVLPDGSVLHGLKRLRKDNTGYDLRHLLIGAEGTLGIITAASLKLFPQPAGEGTAMLVTDSPSSALSLLAMANSRLGAAVTTFELIGRQGLVFLDETMPDLRQPFTTRPDWTVLIELGLPEGLDPGEALERLYVEAEAAGLVSDGVIARSAAQRADLWAVRESLPEANRRIGSISSHDISVPLSCVPQFIDRATERLARIGVFRVNCFGHLGDGNLHFNVFPAPGKTAAQHASLRGQIKDCVHETADDLGGSVSAEHGIGRLKIDDLERFADPAKLAAMRAIKAALDPLGIMNPGAVLRAV